MIKIISFLFLLVSSSHVWARIDALQPVILPTLQFSVISDVFMGHETGNGGDVLVCRDRSGRISKVQLLDIYEAEQRGMSLSYPTGRDYPEILNKILLTLSKWSPARADEYRLKYLALVAKTHFANQQIPDVVDSGYVALPGDCEFKQFAYQYIRNNELNLVIDKTIWEAADEQTKASLIFHELIFSEFRYTGVKSPEVRAFHRLILSDWYQNIRTELEWIDKLISIKTPRTDICGGHFVDLIYRDKFIFDKQGNLSETKSDVDWKGKGSAGKLFVGGTLLKVDYISNVGCKDHKLKVLETAGGYIYLTFNFGGREYKGSSYRSIMFFDDGSVQKTDRYLDFKFLESDLRAEDVSFYRSGKLRSFRLYAAQKISFTGQNLMIIGENRFYETESPLLLNIAEATVFRNCDGEIFSLKKFDRVLFLSNGCIGSIN